MHSSARFTYGERENRLSHRRQKSNENLNYKITCFSLPRLRIGLQWSPASSKKYWKLIKKQRKNYSRTVSGPQLGRPDELWDNLMRVLKLRSSSTTSEQQRSTIGNHWTSIWNFCVPRRRHPRQVEPYLTVIEQKFFHVQWPFLENARHLRSPYHIVFLSTPGELRDDCRRVWKLRSSLIRSRTHPGRTSSIFSPENAIPKSSATSSGVPRILPLPKIRVAHGRPNFCFRWYMRFSHIWRLF